MIDKRGFVARKHSFKKGKYEVFNFQLYFFY